MKAFFLHLCRVLRLCLVIVTITGSIPTVANANSLVKWFQAEPVYVQLITGLASESDFLPSLFFITDQSEENSFITGVSLGRRLSTTLFGLDVDVIGYLGIQNYLERGLQPDSIGLTAYWKTYHEWRPGWSPLTFRFGVGQGLSYASRIPLAEQRDFEPDESAETVHYLEYSLQLRLSELLGLAGVEENHTTRNLWFGYNIFHRSTVFGLFAESGGGINYPGISIQYLLYPGKSR